MGPDTAYPTITVRHVAKPLDVDDFQNPQWNRADPVLIDHYWSGEEAPAGRQAEARLLWSDNALHLRFVYRQAEPPVINPKPDTSKKTIGLWDRDVCEIFLAPDKNVIESYFEFEAAPTGEWLDVAVHWSAAKRDSDWQFNSHLRTAAQVDEHLTTIAMLIPWGERISQPQRGDQWRANLFRCVGSDPGRGYLAWQPTHTAQPNFHVPQVFGWLLFE